MERINNEIYVSLEVAKLLKEAGFDWKCEKCYQQGSINELIGDFIKEITGTPMDNYFPDKNTLTAPTLDITQKWLRELKYIEVNVLCVYIHHVKKYSYTVFKNEYEHEIIGEGFNTYEEAQEAGIKKALEMILKKENKL